jgi:hypothetical protein
VAHRSTTMEECRLRESAKLQTFSLTLKAAQTSGRDYQMLIHVMLKIITTNHLAYQTER